MHRPKSKSTDDTITQYQIPNANCIFANNKRKNSATHKMFGKMVWATNEMQYAYIYPTIKSESMHRNAVKNSPVRII